VDYELTPAEMPAQLIAYAAHAFGRPALSVTAPLPRVEGNALKKIFILLRAQTGHDFSKYKPNTIQRRIERRMAVQQIDKLDGYVRYMQQSPAEVEALFRDMLIGVTNFFRDPDAFQVIEDQVIPKLFAGKRADSVIRIWSVGCSTGEEAYSLAILLAEYLERVKKSFKVQIFATDIDSQAIAIARLGVYPANIAADITPERLARFFTLEPNGSAYRIHKGIRDMLIFSEQDLIKDPPFSRLDLLCCRNLLIYLGADLQKKLMPLFHYALNPGGFLFLGNSESVGDFVDLYAIVDRKAKLYQRKVDYPGQPRATLSKFLPLMAAVEVAAPRAAPDRRHSLSLRELTEQALLQHAGSAAALVDELGNIRYLHGRTGMYLEPAMGEAGVNNIHKMARQGLRYELGASLHKAASTKDVARLAGLRVKTNGDFTTVNLTVRPLVLDPQFTLDSGTVYPNAGTIYLVILEQAPDLPVSEQPEHSLDAEANRRIALLQQELLAKDEYLQSANEELETSNEELKSSNEELQSVNEEMQSTNEELETSKEELQSVNEELFTVNTELQAKVADLSRVNNDMNNLLSGTGIATVFVDLRQRILRFTPAATDVINLIQNDVGRLMGHIASNLIGYEALARDVQSVLDTLIPKDLNVQTKLGRWYTLRILPYRTLENAIEGAVLTFVDVTETILAREALLKANDLLRLAVVVRDARDAITVQDLNGRIIAWNPGAVRMYGWSEAEALSINVSARIPAELRAEALATVHQLSQAKVLQAYFTQRLTKDGRALEVSMTSTALVDEAGQVYAIATTERAKE
jgi:two-component system CheB/CheR fusion protein